MVVNVELNGVPADFPDFSKPPAKSLIGNPGEPFYDRIMAATLEELRELTSKLSWAFGSTFQLPYYKGTAVREVCKEMVAEVKLNTDSFLVDWGHGMVDCIHDGHDPFPNMTDAEWFETVGQMVGRVKLRKADPTKKKS